MYFKMIFWIAFIVFIGFSSQSSKAEESPINSTSLFQAVFKVKCPQCGLEDSEGNRYCLNCAQEIRVLSENEAVKIREENERLRLARQSKVAEISRREAMNNQQRVMQEQQAAQENASRQEEPDFPTPEEYKELKKKNIKNTKNISRKLEKGRVVTLKDLTPVSTEKGIFYHRDELARAHLLPVSYGVQKEYYSKAEVTEMIRDRIIQNGLLGFRFRFIVFP